VLGVCCLHTSTAGMHREQDNTPNVIVLQNKKKMITKRWRVQIPWKQCFELSCRLCKVQMCVKFRELISLDTK